MGKSSRTRKPHTPRAPRTASRSVPSPEGPRVPLSADIIRSHRNNNIQTAEIKNLFTDDGSVTVIYHKLISVKTGIALRGSTEDDQGLEAVAQMLADNVVKSPEDTTPMMSYEEWLEIDLPTLSKLVEAMSSFTGKA